MSFSRSPPQSPSSHDDWSFRNPLLSKTFSTSSSRSMSHNSRSQSFASSSGKAFNASINFEAAARTYHTELRLYLKNLLAQEAIEGPNPQRVSARQKLVRLSNLQFHELAMDVYDEVVRRIKNDKYLPFLPVKEELHPKRNQARQKLATLPVTRFQDLASDVYAEISRRYPSLNKNEESYYNAPLPQSPISPTYGNSNIEHNAQPQPSKSTNIVPVKGTMSVETVDKFSDDEDASSSSYNAQPHHRQQRSSSTSPIEGGFNKDYLTGSSDTRSPKNYQPATDYDRQVKSLNDQIAHLKSELSFYKERKNSNKDADRDLAEKLRIKEQESQRAMHDMEERYQKLSDKYERLKQQFEQHQDAVRDVKAETKQLLDELKQLAEVNDGLLLEKEEAESRIQQLQNELKEMQLKYEKTRIALRNVKATSIIEMSSSSDIIKRSILQPSRNGIIPQDHLLTYQAYIDELLTTARSNDPSRVIHVVKNIVSVCKNITEEIEAREDAISLETKNSLYDNKAQFTTSLSDLLIATKYHANGMGISPVCLIDRSAGHLTSVIVELVKLLGMTSSPPHFDAERNEVKQRTSPVLLPQSSSTADTYSVKTKQPSTTTGATSSKENGGSSNYSSNYHESPSTSKTRSNKTSFPKSVDSALSLDSLSTPDDNKADGYLEYKERQNYKNHTSNSRHHQREEMTPDKLVEYLKSETDNIVQTVQSLLSALRLPQQNGEAHAIINSIIKIVSKIVDSSKNACSTSMGLYYKRDCEPILRQLTMCSQRISVIQSDYFVRGATATANAKRDLAKEAYEIARFTKELINLFETK